jgi:hypothetical protein
MRTGTSQVLRRLGLVPTKFNDGRSTVYQTGLDKERWNIRGIESFDVDLNEYVDALAAKVAHRALPE